MDLANTWHGLMPLLAVAALVGVFIGAVGVGGILLIPALHAFTGLSIQAAMATALFTFIFTGIAGAALFQRRGSIDWRVTLPLCIGAAMFGALGAWANSLLDARPLTLLLAVLIVLAGVYTLRGATAAHGTAFSTRPRLQQALLLGIGALTGFGSGLTGVGGPALSVPMMVGFGFPALSAIGASQVVQILAALSGSAGHLARGVVDLELAVALVVFEVVGVWFGVVLAHRVDALHLRRGVGLLCVMVGAGLLLRTL